MTTGRRLPLLRAALAAADRGWPVFPLIPGSKRPAIGGWPKQATIDADTLHVWWRIAAFNIGIACGPAGLLVLDIDGPDGRAVLARLTADKPPVPTFTVRTPSGGEHRYYTASAGGPAPTTVGRLGPRLDTRGAGGYVVAAGSVGAAGGRRVYYRVRDPRRPALLPDWIGALLHPPLPRTRPPGPPRSSTAYGRAAVARECALVRQARSGTRNAVLFTAAVRLGELVGAGLLDEHDVRTILRAAASVHSGVAGFTASEGERAIANGLRYGTARPRPFTER